MGIDMEDISVHFVDFHVTGIDEQVILNKDGSYTILIDARASYEAQAEAYEHAMSHIRNMDFQKDVVQQIEAAAHRVEEPVPVITLGEVRAKAKKKSSIKDWEKLNGRSEICNTIVIWLTWISMIIFSDVQRKRSCMEACKISVFER